MSKTLTASISAHLASGETTLVTCWKIIREDGTILGFTDNVVDLNISSITYSAATGYTPTALKNNSNLSVDNMDLMGLLKEGGIKADDIDAKKYDNAEIYIFMVDYNNPSSGYIALGRGRIGNIQTKDEMYVAEFRSMTQLLQQKIGERYSIRCRAQFGDSRCGFPINVSAWSSSTAYTSGTYVSPSTYTGAIFKCTTPGTSGASEPSFGSTAGASVTDGASTVWETVTALKRENIAVTSTTDRSEFYASSLLSVFASTGYFNYGLITWTTSSAGNSGYSMDVKSYSSGTITLFEPMPYNISNGDVFTIIPGCDKKIATCINTFDNVVNFRGEPFIPGRNELNKFGGQ